VDALGLIIAVVVMAASATDNQIGVRLLDRVVEHTPDGEQGVGRRRLQRRRRDPRRASTSPRRLAVQARPAFVRAACHPPHHCRDQAALRLQPGRCDGPAERSPMRPGIFRKVSAL
jgi:hypothetical protein